MKRLLLVLLLGVGFVFGQITSIYDIQYVADPETDDASPLVDQVVTVSGVVTAEYWGTSSNRTMFIQDDEAAWCGIMAYYYSDNGWQDLAITFDPGVNRTTVVEGDSVTLTATVTEYYGLTELTDATELIVHGLAVDPPAPMLITPAEGNMEMYEGCLVTAENVTVADPDLGYGEWSFTDGTDTLVTDDTWDYYYYPTTGAEIASITGPMTYSYSARKMLPRLARDVIQAGPFTRTQRIQQVLGSTLYMLPDSMWIDASLLLDDTVTCTAIVTVPTAEISGWDTTGGVLSGYSRFIWQDPNGGPYSSILSYFNDATAFPELFVGDSIIITGYIFEYAGSGSCQFTEMFITEPVTIVGVNATVPEPPVITTGELMLPLTAEQYENNIVIIEGSTVVDNNLPYGDFLIDDGSGAARADGDATNSMDGYDVYGNYIGGEFVIPPNGTTVASIRGYIYHLYGSWEDQTTYALNPVVPADVVLGGGPPLITEFLIHESNLTPDDPVTVSANMVDGSAVESAVVTYRLDGGDWMDAAMTMGEGDNWAGTIPATGTEGTMVEFFVEAFDDGGDNQDEVLSTLFPADTANKRFGYHTKADGHTIYDIQSNMMPNDQSLYDGSVVTVSGIVTTLDDEAGSDFVIQSESAVYSGIVCNDTSGYAPTYGDEVTVRGRVDEMWVDWEFKYGNNTLIHSIQFVEVNSSGNTIEPMSVTGADLLADPEAYEGTLVSTGEVTVTSLNSYDWSVTDGTGEFLIDDDWCDSESYEAMGALAVDDVLAGHSGVWNYSFGSFKTQIRNMVDLGAVGIGGENQVPLTFSLSQNYPNPFNPSTTIEYSLAEAGNHTLKVFDLRGALVTTLVDHSSSAGKYSLVWDASEYASGLYFLRLDAPNFTQTRKLLLVK